MCGWLDRVFFKRGPLDRSALVNISERFFLWFCLPVDYSWTVILFVILCCLSWTVCYCGLIYVSLLPDFMPVFRLRVALSMVVFADNDPDIMTKKLQMNPPFAEASL